MPFIATAKNAMLDALTLDKVRLHSADPGAAGTTAELGSGTVAATFSAASGGSRAIATNVSFTGLGVNQLVTHFSVWSGTTFRGSGAVSGDSTANAEGEYVLTTSTTVSLTDPA